MNTQELITQALRDLAALYDMPELIGNNIMDIPIPEGSRLIQHFRVDVSPRGQLSLFVRNLQVIVSVHPHEPMAGRNLVLQVHLDYEHQSGGGNGNYQSFVILTRTWMDEFEYRGIVEFSRYSTIAEQLLDRVEERLRARAADPTPAQTPNPPSDVQEQKADARHGN